MAKPEAEEERNTLSTKTPNIDTTRSLIDVYALYTTMCMENERTKRTNLVYFTSVTSSSLLSAYSLCQPLDHIRIHNDYMLLGVFCFGVFCLLEARLCLEYISR